MVRSTTIYQGQKHCELTHEPSGSKIQTDAPKDNQGRGEAFSPTDLLGAALSSCILTTMAMTAEKDGVSLQGSQAVVEKVMTAAPRRVESLALKISLPKAVPADYRAKLEEIAVHCPVHRSLHPDINMPMIFTYEI